ncbi:hypothetical protein SEA_POKYPUPPY_97 [Gordonia phage PokyPuppy]|nr:hypothetical protein SEA_POKYPUPPY_97 [Gordonia phage PokyPuppy]
MALPPVKPIPSHLIPTDWPEHARYRVAVWRGGQLRDSRLFGTRTGTIANTEAIIRLDNPNTTRELVWTRLGHELKLSFAVWRDGDTVAYVTREYV